MVRQCCEGGLLFAARMSLLEGQFAETMNQSREGAAAMNTYETTATVEDHGQVHVSGAPFAPGTEVEVTIREKTASQATRADDPALTAARERMRELFRTIKGFRNSPRIPREDLYERGRLH
jgi:hypothetical protein